MVGSDDAAMSPSGRSNERTVVVAGLAIELRTRPTQSGSRMAFLTLDDRTARMEIRIFSKIYTQFEALLAVDKVLVVQGTLGFDDYSGSMRMNANCIYDIDAAREVYARKLMLDIDELKAGNGFIHSLETVLKPFCDGQCPVGLSYHSSTAHASITLGEEWRVHPTDELIHRLKDLTGEEQVKVVYK